MIKVVVKNQSRDTLSPQHMADSHKRMVEHHIRMAAAEIGNPRFGSHLEAATAHHAAMEAYMSGSPNARSLSEAANRASRLS